jgi:hypothetical protein
MKDFKAADGSAYDLIQKISKYWSAYVIVASTPMFQSRLDDAGLICRTVFHNLKSDLNPLQALKCQPLFAPRLEKSTHPCLTPL